MRLTLSKGIEWFNPASPRQWFQPDHNYRDIVAGVVIDGEARWLTHHILKASRGTEMKIAKKPIGSFEVGVG